MLLASQNKAAIISEAPPDNFVETLIEHFGKWGALGIGAALVALFFVYQYLKDRRKNKYFEMVIEEKDKAIQRTADECRYLRFWLFKQTTNLSDEEIKNLVEKNEYPNAEEARKGLEGDEKKSNDQNR